MSHVNTVPMEHERRFVPLLSRLPFGYGTFPCSGIVQRYLDDGTTRLRAEMTPSGDMRFTDTKKTGEGVSRREDEVEITEDVYEELSSRSIAVLTKTRYFVTWEGVDCELNIFHGELAGYVQIEIEFDSAEAAHAFVPPPWFGREVTDDKRHTNAHLARYGIPK